MARKFDPITLEILWRRIRSIVDEADASVGRTAFSSLVRDGHDYCVALADKLGRELAESSGASPGLMGGMTRGIKKIVNMFPIESYKPGDVFISNDPWLLAGHLNDFVLLTPIFSKKNLVAFTASVFHHTDIGGRIGEDNREVYEEGIFIPVSKLYDAGVLNQVVLDIIRWNVRKPEEVIGDLRSQIAANHVCSQKLLQMMEDAGLESLDDLANEIIDITEKEMRDAISSIPDGSYSGEGLFEGMTTDETLKIKLNVEVKGNHVICDYNGSSPQVNWGANIVYNYCYAYTWFGIKTICTPDTPNNEGSTLPVIVKAPEGSIVNCNFPAPTSARHKIGQCLTEIVYRALAPVVPNRVLTASGGSPAWGHRFYGRSHDGETFLALTLDGGGLSASYSSDGSYCAQFPANAANVPCEIFMSDTPIHVEKKSIVCDSGGPGRRRGGVAPEIVFRVPDDADAPIPPTILILRGGRRRFPPQGLFDGKSGANAKCLVNGIPVESTNILYLEPGDVIVSQGAGGGGYGNPFEREPEKVKEDVMNGYVSVEKAEDEYGVIIDPKTMELDYKSTKELRETRKKTLRHQSL